MKIYYYRYLMLKIIETFCINRYNYSLLSLSKYYNILLENINNR